MSVIRSQCKDDAEYLQALRDDFASAALQGMLANPTPGALPEEYAAEAYTQADAMITERDK